MELKLYFDDPDSSYMKEWSKKYCLDIKKINLSDENAKVVYRINNEGHYISFNQSFTIEKEATCMTDGIRIKYCDRCGEIAVREVIPADSSLHVYEWVVSGDTRTRTCKLCDHKKESEIGFGNAWGNFNEEKADEQFSYINSDRKYAIEWVVDPFGNVLDLLIPEPLVYDETLEAQAKEEVKKYIEAGYVWSDREDMSATYWVRYRDYRQHTDACGSKDVVNDMKYSKVGVAYFEFNLEESNNRTEYIMVAIVA